MLNIRIRKKLGPIATEPVTVRGLSVTTVCPLFGHCRQAFYQSKADIQREVRLERTLVRNVEEIRTEDPGIGAHKLWLMLRSLSISNVVMPGCERFCRLLRRDGLILSTPRPRHTTNSNHRYHKWRNLIRGFVPSPANQLWVSDITYIMLSDGNVCCLHLIINAYSHTIIGWVLTGSFRAAITMQALE